MARSRTLARSGSPSSSFFGSGPEASISFSISEIVIALGKRFGSFGGLTMELGSPSVMDSNSQNLCNPLTPASILATELAESMPDSEIVAR